MLGDWALHFPDCEPVAYWLRAALPARWVRFHSLPGSKRYPEDEGELAVVLERQNRILDELVGAGGNVILLTTECSRAAAVSPSDPHLRTINGHAKPWRTVPMHDLDGGWDAPSYWHVLASEWAWSPGVLDPVLRLVVDDLIANVMILPPDCTWLFHPYDGGMDLILESSAARDRIRSAHADWLSPRPDGL